MTRIKQRVPLLILLFLSLVFFPTRTIAEAINLPEGFLISDDQGMSVTKNGGYFFKLNDLFPGDTVTRKLTIKSTSKEDHTLKMYLEPISNQGPADLLKNMEMQLTYDQQLIFDGNLVNQNKDIIDVGTEIDFGTIKGQSETTIDIVIDVQFDVPWEHFVKEQSKATVRWIFVAERAKKTQPPTKPIVKPTQKFPQTGEQRALWLTILGVIVLVITWSCYYLWHGKKQEAENN